MPYIDDVIDACVAVQAVNPAAVPDDLAATMIKAGWSIAQVKAFLFDRLNNLAMGPKQLERDAERLWLLAEACGEGGAAARVVEFAERGLTVEQAKAEIAGKPPSPAPWPGRSKTPTLGDDQHDSGARMGAAARPKLSHLSRERGGDCARRQARSTRAGLLSVCGVRPLWAVPQQCSDRVLAATSFRRSLPQTIVAIAHCRRRDYSFRPHIVFLSVLLFG